MWKIGIRIEEELVKARFHLKVLEIMELKYKESFDSSHVHRDYDSDSEFVAEYIKVATDLDGKRKEKGEEKKTTTSV